MRNGSAMVSLPIPLVAGKTLDGITHTPFGRLAALASDLSQGGFSPSQTFHFDPDLYRDWFPRPEAWLPAFGQDGSAQRHLENEGVGRGDLFLFFGWFRQVERTCGRWEFLPGAPDVHVLFGWLQADRVISLPNNAAQAAAVVAAAGYPWLREHPHVQFASLMGRHNTVYVASKSLTLGGHVLPGVAGAGTFRYWHRDLQLTRGGNAGRTSRTTWALPVWCSPGAALSYHHKLWRWSPANGAVHLRSVNKGQEFVLDIGAHAPALRWIKDRLAYGKGESF